jgi:hypothetical protein
LPGHLSSDMDLDSGDGELTAATAAAAAAAAAGAGSAAQGVGLGAADHQDHHHQHPSAVQPWVVNTVLQLVTPAELRAATPYDMDRLAAYVHDKVRQARVSDCV